MQAYPIGARAKPDGGAALRAVSARPPSHEPTLDQLLAEPIVRRLMRRDRIDEAAIRRLVRETAAARLATQARDDSDAEEPGTEESGTEESGTEESGTGDPHAIVRLLHEIARQWPSHYDREVRARFPGMSRARCAVLAYLARHEGVNQVTLARLLDIRPISLVRLLDRLEAAGFVVRRPDPDDRRVHVLALTAKALPIVERIDGLARKIHDDLQLGISKAEASQLHALLFRIRSKLAGRPGEIPFPEPLQPRRHA